MEARINNNQLILEGKVVLTDIKYNTVYLEKEGKKAIFNVDDNLLEFNTETQMFPFISDNEIKDTKSLKEAVKSIAHLPQAHIGFNYIRYIKDNMPRMILLDGNKLSKSHYNLITRTTDVNGRELHDNYYLFGLRPHEEKINEIEYQEVVGKTIISYLYNGNVFVTTVIDNVLYKFSGTNCVVSSSTYNYSVSITIAKGLTTTITGLIK